jgi:ubiquitin-like 1-activating enzyme E1 B
VFDADVRNLLSMADMWRTRAPPVPLPFDEIRSGSFELPERLAKHMSTLAVGQGAAPAGSSGTEAAPAGTNGKAKVDAAKLRDQKVLGLQETVELFVSAYVLSLRGMHTWILT